MFFFYAIIFFSGKSFVKPNLSSLKGRDRRTWIYMELTYEPIVKQNSRIFHHAPFSSSALCETFKRTQHVSTFCSFIFLASAFITYVGDQCDVFFLTRSFIGIKSMGLRPWSVNFFVWFTLFDVMLIIIIIIIINIMIIRLKKVCIHMDIIVERLRRRPLFLYWGSKRAIKRRSTTVDLNMQCNSF